MPSIRIRRRHRLSHDEAVAAVNRIANELASEYGVRIRWQDDRLSFERPALSGHIDVHEDDIVIDASVGLSLMFFRQDIEREIDRLIEAEFR
ncbi:polyhydroxyalkanoic acid system family protein [Lentisalinibacter orientalis]|jgi:putative polyhydroxyalkanoate system protein|uniref:polyhydroxyalkanoic acid system family protein n=1 Tax=Lentisalinibacter orientalis TaxID=2992241 RepID=UPI00386601E1